MIFSVKGQYEIYFITGLMPGKVKYCVGKLSVSQIPLSMKLSGNLVTSHWKSGLGMRFRDTA